MPNDAAGFHLTAHAITLATPDGDGMRIAATPCATPPDPNHPADTAARLRQLLPAPFGPCVVAVPPDWPLPAWFALQAAAHGMGLDMLRVISALAAAGLAFGLREDRRNFLVADAGSGLAALCGREQGSTMVEVHRTGPVADLIQPALPGVACGGDVAGIALRDDALPVQGALLQAMILVGNLGDLLLLDGAACSFQYRTPSRRWKTLCAAGLPIPLRAAARIRTAGLFELRALSPSGTPWAQWQLPLPTGCGKRSAIALDIDTGQQARLHLGGGGTAADICLFGTGLPGSQGQASEFLSQDEVEALLAGLVATPAG